MRFDDAIKTYGRLYDLTYRDPQWMIKVAELHARSSRSSEAVGALKTAVIGARTETADADFEIARQLESSHISCPRSAATFAERGARMTGSDSKLEGGNLATYTRIMALARRFDGQVLAHPESNVGSLIAGNLSHARGEGPLRV